MGVLPDVSSQLGMQNRHLYAAHGRGQGWFADSKLCRGSGEDAPPHCLLYKAVLLACALFRVELHA